MGQRGLARSRRPPQHHRGELVCLDEGPKGFTRPEQMVLPNDVVEPEGPKPGRQRGPAGEQLVRCVTEQVVAPHGAKARRVGTLPEANCLLSWQGAEGAGPTRRVDPGRGVRVLR